MQFNQEQSHNVSDAIIYCRVSSKAQTKRGDGLNSQETRCREYAKYKGYDVRNVFTDDLTGQTSDRPGLQSLLKYLKADRKTPHVVIIDDLSRFARRVPIHFELREAIALAGGILESPSVELRDDADGELHEYILASVSQHQSRKNAEQTLNRMRARAMNGYYVFSAPAGYKYQRVKGHGNMLVKDEPVASILKEALEGFASGRFQTRVEVKRFLETKPDFPKCLPNGTIRHQRMRDYLGRITYAGYIEIPNWNVPLREGQHEAIISLATYQKIQERLAKGAYAPARIDLNHDYPLRGFVTCADCDKPLTACWSKSSTGKKHPYYLCYNKNCVSNRKSIPKAKIEDEFAELLTNLTPNENMFALAKAMFENAWDVRLGQFKQHKQSYQDKIVALDIQIEQLVDRIVDSESQTAITAYEKRIAKLEREKMVAQENASKSKGPSRSFDEMFERAMVFLANPCKLWLSDDYNDKRAALKLTFTGRLAYDRKTGFRTPQVSEPFTFLGDIMQKSEMAHPGRFELPTP